MNFTQNLDQIFLNIKCFFIIIIENYFRNLDYLETIKKLKKNLDNFLSSL
jgi:hypothetical protein